MIPLNGQGKFKQGIYRPKYPEKYIGKEVPVYRSSWEVKFFHWCDTNPNVLEWASEAVIIPYMNPLDGKYHRYHTDGVVAIRENNNVITKYIIEIKPSKQLVAPIASKRKRSSTLLYENQQYITNHAKWESAKKWCTQKGYKFLILTEQHLNIK